MVEQHSKIKIFLLRGLVRETRHWGSFLPELAQSFPDAAICPLEIPGTGVLRHQPSPTSIKEYVEVIRQQYLAKRTDGDDCKLIGFSLGGMIGARWLESHPRDFSAAVLINSSCRSSPVFRRMQISGGAPLLSLLFHRDPLRREKKIVSLLCNLADQEKTAQEWAEISRTAPVSLVNFLRQLYAAIQFQLPAKVEVPVLLLCSRADKLVSFKCSEDIGSLWHSEPVYHDLAGHDLTTDDPVWCTVQLRSWPPFGFTGIPSSSDASQ